MDKLTQLQARVQAMLAAKRAMPQASASPPPRYDEVYARGVAWLDALAEGNPGLADALALATPERPKRLSRRRKAILRRFFWSEQVPKEEWARRWDEYTRLVGQGHSPRGRPFRRKWTAARLRTSSRSKR